MKQIETNKLKVSETTAQFIAALDLLEQTKDQFLTALQSLFGEDRGEKIFLETVQEFDDAGRYIAANLSLSITSHLDNKNQRAVI